MIQMVLLSFCRGGGIVVEVEFFVTEVITSPWGVESIEMVLVLFCGGRRVVCGGGVY